jgi:hypothetical protein
MLYFLLNYTEPLLICIRILVGTPTVVKYVVVFLSPGGQIPGWYLKLGH